MRRPTPSSETRGSANDSRSWLARSRVVENVASSTSKSSATTTEGGNGELSWAARPTKDSMRRSRADRSASKKSSRSSSRLDRSPGWGRRAIRSNAGARSLRGKAASFSPRRHTTRNGMLRIGSSAQKVTPPVRKVRAARSESSIPRSTSAIASRSTRPSKPAKSDCRTSASMASRTTWTKARCGSSEETSRSSTTSRVCPQSEGVIGASIASRAEKSRSAASASLPISSPLSLLGAGIGKEPPNGSSRELRAWPSSRRSRPNLHVLSPWKGCPLAAR